MSNEMESGDLIKMIWWDGQGACLFSKRLSLEHTLQAKSATHSAAVTASTVRLQIGPRPAGRA